MLPWHPLLEWQRVHSRRMKNLTSSPPPVKNGEFLEKVSPQASCFSPGVMKAHTVLRLLHSPFSENHKGVAHLSPWRSYPTGSSFSSIFILQEPILHSPRTTKGCHTFPHGEAILLAHLFPHSPFSEKVWQPLLLMSPQEEGPRRVHIFDHDSDFRGHFTHEQRAVTRCNCEGPRFSSKSRTSCSTDMICGDWR